MRRSGGVAAPFRKRRGAGTFRLPCPSEGKGVRTGDQLHLRMTLLGRRMAPGVLALLLAAAPGCARTAPSAVAHPTIRAAVDAQVHRVSGVPADLGAVDFLNARQGWVAGGGVILATADGGSKWTTQYAGVVSATSLDFVNATAGWALGSGAGAGLLRTTDGGRRWTAAAEPPPVTAGGSAQPMRLRAVDFVSPTVGYGVAAPGGVNGTPAALEATADGGGAWTPVATPVAPQSACFTSPTTGWLAGRAGQNDVVYRTSDAGRIWTSVFHQAVQSNLGLTVGCGAPDTVWLLVDGAGGLSQESYALWRSPDGGQRWKAVAAVAAGAGPAPGPLTGAAQGPGEAPGALVVANAQTAYLAGVCTACGLEGTVTLGGTTDGGSNWENAPAPIPGMPPNDPGFSFPTATDGWAVGRVHTGESVLLRTTDGGRAWTTAYRWLAGTPTEALSFVTARVGYGLGLPGDPGAVLRTADGGQTWERVGEVPQAPSASTAGLAFTDSTHGYALAGGRLYGTADGGRTWAPVPLTETGNGKGSPITVSQVAFGGRRQGCVRVEGGLPAFRVTLDGGSHWTAAPDQRPVGDGAVACAAAATDTAWTTDFQALQASAARASPVVVALQPLAVRGAVGWALFAHTLYATTDGGRAWTPFTLSATVKSLAVASPERAWLLTGNDRLLTTTDGGSAWSQIGTG